MTLPTFDIAINRQFVNRLEQGDSRWGTFNDTFENVTLSADALREEIRAGHAFTSPHHHNRHLLPSGKMSAYRHGLNWIDSQVCALDHDDLGIEAVLELQGGFIHQHGSFLYTTASHTPEAPRCRSVFVLEQPVSKMVLDQPLVGKELYSTICAALLWTFSGVADRSCKDVARCFFGSKDCGYLVLGNVLPNSVLNQIVSDFCKAMDEERNRRPDFTNYRASAPKLAEIQDALEYIPSEMEYIDWLRILMAVHSVFPGEDGIAVCEEWSPGYPGEIEYKFGSFNKAGNESGAVTIATLFGMAKEYGWQPSSETYEDDTFDNAFSQNGAGYGVPISIVGETEQMPPLPKSAYIDPEVAAGASPWLDAYIDHSRKWSPRSYDSFHLATGLFVLSTVSARRVHLEFGGPRYTNLNLCLAAPTSKAAKTTAAKVGLSILHDAKLDYLLAPDDATPQAFIRALAGKLPDDWGQWSSRRQKRYLDQFAFAGQKGWFYEEFGQKVSAMMKEGGFMADFRGILKKFDDTPPTYEYVSIGRGSDLITAPYIAMLANVTPADLRPFAKKGAALWGDGFWARVAFITAPPDAPVLTGRFPEGKRVTPHELLVKLKEWHKRLGIPRVTIAEKTVKEGRGRSKGVVKYEAKIHAPELQECTLGDGVVDAYYCYHDALTIDLFDQKPSPDLDGNYNRFAEKALRVAMLLGSLENDNRIEMRHWARAQQIAESWRQNLHYFYAEVTGSQQSRGEEIEEKVMGLLARKGPMTFREMRQYIRGIDARNGVMQLSSMVNAGLLEVMREGKTIRYHLAH